MSTEVKKEIQFDDFVNKIPNSTNTSEIFGSVADRSLFPDYVPGHRSLVPYHRLLSPEFSCFGNKWRLEIVFLFKKTVLRKFPCVSLYLHYLSDKSIMIGFSVAIMHSKGEKRLGGNLLGLQTFDSCRRCSLTSDKLFPLHSLMRCLVDGTLICKVTMRTLGDPVTRLPKLEVPTSVVEACPICMEPISKPWGVVTPCGHPFHLSCWDEVVTRHQRSEDELESDDEALPSCAVCRKHATGFQQVYLDLGCTEASAAAISSETDERNNEHTIGMLEIPPGGYKHLKVGNDDVVSYTVARGSIIYKDNKASETMLNEDDSITTLPGCIWQMKNNSDEQPAMIHIRIGRQTRYWGNC